MMQPSPLERFGRRLRIAMIGGGPRSAIGESHRIALRADGLWDLVAGVFSRDPAVSEAFGRAMLIDPARLYRDHRHLIEEERRRLDPVDAVIVATLPGSHAEITADLLDAGFHVVSEKPLTSTGEQARTVAAALARSDRQLLLTHCYSGYPMIRMVRDLVRRGDLGQLRIIDTEFANGLYAGGAETDAWRVGSTEAGRAGMLLDLGTHAIQLATYTSGQQVTKVAARLDTIVPGHEVYDNAFLNLSFDGGAVGRCWSTYQAAGAVHGLRIALYGDKGSLAWDHEHAETLWWRPVGGPEILLTKAGADATEGAIDGSRFSAGHPDGYGLAFANLYRDFALALIAASLGENPVDILAKIPGIADGLHTLEVVAAALRSHDAGGRQEGVPSADSLSSS